MFIIEEYQILINDLQNAQTNIEKGERYETLCEYLFNCLDGIKIEERDARMEAEEIDLVIWNSNVEEVFRPWDSIILVECKNWTSAVGANMLDSFIAKIRRRSLKTGIFIAANGVTGDFIKGDGSEAGAVAIIRSALQEGIRIITIKNTDLFSINSIDDFRELIRKRYCGIFVHKVF